MNKLLKKKDEATCLNDTKKCSSFLSENDRSQISEVAGKGKYKDLEPGWVWNLAMKHAKNDPNSAMYLIGMCGHDDVSQGSYFYMDESPQALDQLRPEIEALKKQKMDIDQNISGLKKNFDLNQEKIVVQSSLSADYAKKIKDLESRKSLGKYMSCPSQDGGFYAPRSLGSSADIPDQIKNDIERIQGADGAKNIPSKYYHVYGSAFMACQLVQNGVSPKNAVRIQKQAARLYRGIRMCSSVSGTERRAVSFLKQEERLQEHFKVTDREALAEKLAEKLKGKGRLRCEEKRSSSDIMFCQYFRILDLRKNVLSKNYEISKDLILKRMNGKSKSFDAAALYRSWYLGGRSILGQPMPCTDMRVWGPADLMNPTDSFFTRVEKPSGWSDDRYTSASRKLATWDVDFKWTLAQHQAGAEFAGKNCRRRSSAEPVLRGICPKGPPDGKTVYQSGSSEGGTSSSAAGTR